MNSGESAGGGVDLGDSCHEEVLDSSFCALKKGFSGEKWGENLNFEGKSRMIQAEPLLFFMPYPPPP